MPAEATAAQNPQEATKSDTVFKIVVLATIFMAGFYLLSFWDAFRCNVSLTFESHVLWFANQLTHGQNIYDPSRLRTLPAEVCIYPPLYPALIAPWLSAFGASFYAGRIISALSTIGTAVLFAFLIRKQGCSWTASLTAVIFFLSFVPTWYTSFLIKSDFLANFLCTAALLLFFQELSSNRENHIGSAVLASVAFLARQQSLVIAAAIAIYLIATKRFRGAARFTAVWLVSMLLTTVLLQLATGGYLQHLLFLKGVTWSWKNEIVQVASLGFDAIKLACAAIVICTGAYFSRRELHSWSFPVILLIVSLALMSYSLGVPGAGSNHFISVLFALSWLLALATERFPKSALLIVSLSVLPLQIMYDFLHGQVETNMKSARTTMALTPRNSTILTDDPYWAMASGSKSALVDCVSFLNVWRNNPAAQQDLIDAINHKQFGAVIINATDVKYGGGNIWTPPIVDAVKRNYTPTGTGTGNGISQTIMVPK